MRSARGVFQANLIPDLRSSEVPLLCIECDVERGVSQQRLSWRYSYIPAKVLNDPHYQGHLGLPLRSPRTSSPSLTWFSRATSDGASGVPASAGGHGHFRTRCPFLSANRRDGVRANSHPCVREPSVQGRGSRRVCVLPNYKHTRRSVHGEDNPRARVEKDAPRELDLL